MFRGWIRLSCLQLELASLLELAEEVDGLRQVDVLVPGRHVRAVLAEFIRGVLFHEVVQNPLPVPLSFNTALGQDVGVN